MRGKGLRAGKEDMQKDIEEARWWRFIVRTCAVIALVALVLTVWRASR
jgi:hypothetical protein